MDLSAQRSPNQQDVLQDPHIRRIISLLLVQSKDHAVVLLDPQGLIIAWLGCAEAIFGYTAEEMVGQHTSIIFTPEDLDKHLDRYEQDVALVDSRSEDDRWHVRKDGVRIWVTGTINVLRDETGAAIGLAKIMRDRTDLRSRIETLENRVSALQDTHERTQRYLGTLGHELRNPLGVISNAVQVLAHTALDDAGDKRLRIIQRQVALLTQFSEDLTDLSRLTVRKLTLHREPIVLQPLLHEMAAVMQERAQQKGLRLETILPEGTITVDADPARLQQIVLNLLDNAVKYTPTGGCIWLKATEEASDAVIRIEDTGLGISAEMLPRIFELFTQEPGAAQHAPGGLGIGLALVRELVELHGGEVLVRSNGPGKGSEFTVYLPLVQRSEGQGG